MRRYLFYILTWSWQSNKIIKNKKNGNKKVKRKIRKRRKQLESNKKGKNMDAWQLLVSNNYFTIQTID